jgi:hypothetical protein
MQTLAVEGIQPYLIDTSVAALPHYALQTDNPRQAPWVHHSWSVGAGSVYANTSGLHGWFNALQSGAFLNQENLALLFEGAVASGNGKKYAMGWESYERDEKKYIHHDGAIYGYASEAAYLPETGHWVILLTNQTHELKSLGQTSKLLQSMRDQIFDVLLGKETALLDLPVDNQSPDGLRWGEYTSGNGWTVSINPEEYTMVSQAGKPLLAYPFLSTEPIEKKHENTLNAYIPLIGQREFDRSKKYCTRIIKLIPMGPVKELWRENVPDEERFVKYWVYDKQEIQGVWQYKVMMQYEKSAFGLLLALNDKGKIQGFFNDREAKANAPLQVQFHKTGPGRYFIDGFKFGFPDVNIQKINDNEFVFHFTNGKSVKFSSTKQ